MGKTQRMHDAPGILRNPRSVNLTYHAMRQAAFLGIIYSVLLLVLPSGRTALLTYHLTMFEYHIISFAASIPGLLVWVAAFIGYTTLRQYAYSLRNAPERENFDRLATGCEWLAWSLPVSAIASLILSSMAYKWPGFQPTSVILTNYVNLLIPLIAFSIIGFASRGLLTSANLKVSLPSAHAIILLFLTAGVVYCYLTFSHFNLSNFGSSNNPYYLPIWLMLITVIIPNLYAWFVGILATYEITLLGKYAHGIIYRRAMQYLAIGLVTIIISLISLQYVNSVHPRVEYTVFGYIFIANILFRIIGGIGFVLLTIGAFKLKKIEEV